MKYLLSLFILIILFIFWAVYLPKEFDSGREKVFSIKRGEGAKEISVNLYNQDLIKLKSFFRLYIFLKGEQKNLKAGDYLLSKSMNIPEIVKKFVRGDTIKNKITIIEGWNLKDIALYLEDKGFSREELENINIDADKFDFLFDRPENAGLEGYLFPDTYEISKEDSLEEVVDLMLNNFGSKMAPELKEEIKSQGKSIFEIITVASLLEEEVKSFDDKKIVSGIIKERLKLGVPLQIDASITYLTGKKSVEVSKEDTEIDSPYNTYKYKGLPLGPIANPGLESIKAAIFPQESDFFYYLSTAEGETIFSKTLEEHNAAKSKYLK